MNAYIPVLWVKRLRPMSRWSSERAFKHLVPAAGAEKLGLIKYNYGLIMVNYGLTKVIMG